MGTIKRPVYNQRRSAVEGGLRYDLMYVDVPRRQAQKTPETRTLSDDLALVQAERRRDERKAYRADNARRQRGMR